MFIHPERSGSSLSVPSCLVKAQVKEEMNEKMSTETPSRRPAVVDGA